MSESRNLFWDSCVFIRYITQRPEDDLHILEAIIKDTRTKVESERQKIFFSSLIFTEVLPKHLKSGAGSIDDFFNSLGSNFEQVDPGPQILKWAGQLRDAEPTDPGTAGKKSKRVIGTPDAIHLMTAVFVAEVLGVSDLVFHTYDKGKGATWEGKCVPLLKFEEWFPEEHRPPRVRQVCRLPRRQPWHPNPV